MEEERLSLLLLVEKEQSRSRSRDLSPAQRKPRSGREGNRARDTRPQDRHRTVKSRSSRHSILKWFVYAKFNRRSRYHEVEQKNANDSISIFCEFVCCSQR